MPNPRSRFFAMQETRRHAKWTRYYVKLCLQAMRRGDPISARSASEIAHAEAVQAAHWARLWKDDLGACPECASPREAGIPGGTCMECWGVREFRANRWKS